MRVRGGDGSGRRVPLAVSSRASTSVTENSCSPTVSPDWALTSRTPHTFPARKIPTDWSQAARTLPVRKISLVQDRDVPSTCESAGSVTTLSPCV